MPTDLSPADLKAYRSLVADLEQDLHHQVDADAALSTALEAAWTEARDKERTADSFSEWLDAYITQVAVAWVLTTIFARYLEDNHLISEPRIAVAAADKDRKNRLDDTYQLYFRQNPLHSDTDYLRAFFEHLATLPAGEVFSAKRNPLYRMEISGDAGRALLRFFRHVDPDTGDLNYSFGNGSSESWVLSSGKNPRFTDHFPETETQNPKPKTQNRALGEAEGAPQNPKPKTQNRALGKAGGASDTRFLGDLYQDLSEDARKRYALLQTPDFVEEFILEHTLIPAIDTFGLDEVRFIDPTCGSGHFLLGGFHLLLDRKLAARPNENRTILVREALDATYGVDLNPFAVSIARFRLTIAALFALGDDNPMPLDDAPRLPLNIAVGDSLIHGRHFTRFETDATGHTAQLELDQYRWQPEHFGTEDNDLIYGADGNTGILMQQYHAVVGNPPYITVKDSKLRDVYREHYASAYMQYALVCPFFERFFELATGSPDKTEANALLTWNTDHQKAGYVGMIVANSFMKRQFGKKLIESIIPNTDLTHVIDTSGAYIPGHGTPTTILFGRNQPHSAGQLRTVLGIRGEPKTPQDPANGLVWRSIADHLQDPEFENDFVSIEDSDRALFHTHPWTMRGGGALAAKTAIESDETTPLAQLIDLIGFVCMTRADQLYFTDRATLTRSRIGPKFIVENCEGEKVRNWKLTDLSTTLFPYNEELAPIDLSEADPVHQFLWPHRTHLWLRREPNGNHKEIGLTWHEWSRFQKERYISPLSITFAFVATHNHFVLDRGGKVFNRSAPVIKLPEDATLDDHLALLGPLNSSTACFWMKMVFYPKGGDKTGDGGRRSVEQWHDRYEHDGTKMKLVPIPDERPFELPTRLDTLARQLADLEPTALAQRAIPHPDRLDEARTRSASLLGQMIALQEELDWQCYGLYGLIDQPPLADNLDDLPELHLGERAFEIVLARKMRAGTIKTSWFKRHKSKPITKIPTHWPDWYRDLVQQRIDRIADTRFVRLIEQPEFKRRWNIDPWKKREEAALETWLLDRLETARYFPHAPDRITLTSPEEEPQAQPKTQNSDPKTQNPTLTSISDIAREARKDEDFLQVAARYTDDPSFDVEKLVEKLILANAVPYLPSQRYKKSGIRRRKDWEKVWDLQRQEDALNSSSELGVLSSELNSSSELGVLSSGKNPQSTDHSPESETQNPKPKTQNPAPGESKTQNPKIKIPKPPNYRQSDFENGPTYSLRGKLDVPRERFTLYPDCETSEGSPRITWAGLNHLQRAKALAAFYYHAKDSEGWPPSRLTPLLAGLKDLLPWLHQWHPEPDPDFGQSFAEFIDSMLDQETRELAITPEEIETGRLS